MSEAVKVETGEHGEGEEKHNEARKKMRKAVRPVAGRKTLGKVEGSKPPIRSKQSALILLDKPRVNSPPLTPGDLSRLRQELAEELEDR